MATIPEPLFFTEDNNLQIMTANDIAEIVQQVIALLADDKSVTLFNDTQSNLSSAGRTLVEGLPIADTRLSSGEAAVGGASPPAEGTTGEPETVTTNFNQVGHTTTSGLTLPTDPLPLFRRSDGNIQSMTSTDFLDTFIRPAITLLVSTDNTTSQGGTYRIHTATSLSGHTRVGSQVVFTDTRADVSEYDAANIGTAGTVQDISETINNYYLMEIDANAPSSTIKCPAFKRVDDDIQAYTLTNFNAMLTRYAKYTTTQSNGDRLKYQFATSAPSGGVQKGSSIVDTRLDGSGDRQTLNVGANDYRAQEFPDGTAQTITTTGLYLVRY